MHRAIVLAFVIGFVAALAPLADAAAEIRFVERRPDAKQGAPRPLTEWSHVILEGRITPGDARSAQAVLARAFARPTLFRGGSVPIVTAFLRSPGGDVEAAIVIGRLFRERGVDTYVDSVCASSCVLVFAGGVRRDMSADGRVGLHRPRFEDYEKFAALNRSAATANYNAIATAIRMHFSEMGISSKLVEQMLSVPSEKIVYIGREQAADMGLVGEDAAYFEWVRARETQYLGSETQKAMDRYLECTNRCVSGSSCTDDCFLRFLRPFIDAEGTLIRR